MAIPVAVMRMFRSPFTLFLLCGIFLGQVPAFGYSLLTHEALIDLTLAEQHRGRCC